MKKELKASFTLEAAVVVPLSMVIIVCLIFFGFYLHDVVLTETIGPAAVLEEAGKFKSSDYDAKRATEDMLAKRLSATGTFSVDITGEEDVNILISAGFNWPFQNIISSPGLSGIKTKINLSNLDGRKQLLKYKMLKDGVKNLIGGMAIDGD